MALKITCANSCNSWDLSINTDTYLKINTEESGVGDKHNDKSLNHSKFDQMI